MVVDDEPLVRRGLVRFLGRQPGVALTPEAADGVEAIRLIEEHRPDLVFLDIQMPELDGFEVLESLDPEAQPAVVFVTAYDEHALRAFEVHAVDYLLKPFDDERLATALERARQRLDGSNGRPPDLTELLASVANRSRKSERLLVRAGGRIQFVPVDTVIWFEARDNYVRLHTPDGTHLIRETIKALGARLPADRFARIHRSTIVNLTKVAELRPLPSGDSDVLLDDGTGLRLSRGYREEFERRMRAV